MQPTRLGIGIGITIGGTCNAPLLTPSGASYLLDTYPAFAAYSTRQLSSTATNCMDVRESSGSTVATIGFSGGWLDEAAIATHCGANNGFVAVWYDQSGNTYDVTNATAANQPQVYNGSAVLKVNSKPCMQFNGSTQYLANSSIVSVNQPFMMIHVWDCTEDTTTAGFHAGFSNAGVFDIDIDRTGTKYRFSAGSSIGFDPSVTLKQGIWRGIADNTNGELVVNSESKTGTVGAGATGTALGIGAGYTGAFPGKGNSQEFIAFASAQIASKTEITANINTAFSVYA